jgi:hypothetical protein
MKEVYILQASSRAFIKSIDQDEIEHTIVITADLNQAKQYERCGDAMIAAVNINDIFGKDLFRVVSMNVK